MIKCKMCNCKVRSLSPMRKWCVDCRKKLAVIRAKEKKMKLRKLSHRNK